MTPFAVATLAEEEMGRERSPRSAHFDHWTQGPSAITPAKASSCKTPAGQVKANPTVGSTRSCQDHVTDTDVSQLAMSPMGPYDLLNRKEVTREGTSILHQKPDSGYYRDFKEAGSLR